jgi:transcriptional regulator of heat shock response
MTPRRTDLQDRKERILAITVDEYTKTVSPVSSSCLLRKYGLDLSSATIRNVLAELEEEGYLSHPHTSAGRVPTQRGYRYYVDHLMGEIQMLEEEKTRIRGEYQKESAELDRLLEKTSRVLSQTTHCTSLVSIDGDTRIFCQGTSFVVEYPDYQDISKIRGILAALDEKERLLQLINKELDERTTIFIGKELECEDIDACSLVVSRYQSKHGPSGRIAVLGPTWMDYKRVVSTLDYFSDLIEEIC